MEFSFVYLLVMNLYFIYYLQIAIIQAFYELK